MPKFIIDDKLHVQGLDIAYKVAATSSDKQQAPIFILDLQSLAFSSKALQPHVGHYQDWQKKNPLPQANYILIDNPGSGGSDKVDPEKCTIDYFTEAAARVVEEVARKLNVQKMQLYVQAGADASLVAMNLVNKRPEWVQASSPIQIRMITNRMAAVNNASSIARVEERYKNDPKLPEYVAALKKIESGEVKDNVDLIKNVNGKLAPLMMNTKSWEFRLLGKYVLNHPERALSNLKFLRKIAPTQKLKDYFDLIIEVINGCNVDVLNQFNKTNYGNFDLEKLIKENLSLFSKVPIICLDAADNVLCPAELNSHKLRRLLPNTLLALSLQGKPFDVRGQCDDFYQAIYSGQLESVCSGSEFKKLYTHARVEAFTHQVSAQPKVKSTYAKNYESLGCDGKTEKTITSNVINSQQPKEDKGKQVVHDVRFSDPEPGFQFLDHPSDLNAVNLLRPV